MDDFTSLITDATVQYQNNGVMKDYTTDVHLEDNTPLSFLIKATVPQGTLASIENVESEEETTQETVVKNQTLTYNLPEQLKVEDTQTNKLYLENDLVHSIGTYEIRNNLLTIYFDEDHVNTNAEGELKLALVLETDSSHVIYDVNGSSLVSFNTKNIELNKYIEQPVETTVTNQMDEQVVEEVKNNAPATSVVNSAAVAPETPVTVSDNDTAIQPKAEESTDFGQYITSADVSKIQNGSWVSSETFEDGDQVKVHINYNLPADIVTTDKNKISYQLPSGIKPLKEETGLVYASNGKAVGTYLITTEGKITIDFNADFATGEPFSGYIEFQGTVSADGADDDGSVKFDGDGGEITVKPSKEQYDLNMSKQASLNDDGTVSYTVKASTKNGTEGTIKIEDKFVDWDSAKAEYNVNSFKVIKKDKDGISTPMTATPSINGESFTINDLPKLEAGESYEITYTAKATPSNKDGSGSLTNSVKGTSGNTSKETSTSITISNSMISKYGGYDQNTGKMNWSITINPDKKDIGGYVFNDTIDNSLEIPTPITVKGSDGSTFTIDSLPYTFPDSSNETYTIEYQTDAPKENVTVTNTGTIGKDGTTYESSYGVGVNHRDWDITKSSTGNTVSEDGKTITNTWQAYMKLPDKEITSVTYSDVIKNGTSTGDKDFIGEHYAVLSELRKEINNNIELKDANGFSISKDDLEVSVKFYLDENKNNEVTNDDAHVKAFEVTVKKKDGSKFIGQSLNISSYHTIGDLKGVKEGIDYYFVNKGTVQDKESESKVTYNKPKKFVKQGFGKIDGGTYDKYSSSKVSTDYISRDGKLYYRIIFTPDSNERISVTDTLPEGTKLVKKDERSDYENVGYKDNPEDRGSPEAIYHFGDNVEWYCDGDANFTDIRKYFIYSYDGTTNKITFTFTSGYNKADGDYNTGKRNHPNGAIAIYYAVDITSDEFWKDLKNENKEYTNTLDYEGKSQEQHTEVERETQNVTKTAKQIDNTTKVEYSVIINPAAKDLNPKSDKITLNDKLEYSDNNNISPYLVLSSLKLYEYDADKVDHKGKLIDESRYQVQIDDTTHKLTVTLPDELACVLGYQYDFDVGQAAHPTIKNNVSLEGEFSSSVDTNIDISQSSAGVIRGKMTIYKVDSKDYSKKLPNAKFKLWEFDKETKDWKAVTKGSTDVFETNEDGEIVFSGSSEDKFLVANTLYRLEETEAPSGYDKDENPHYFVIYQADQNKTKQDAKAVLSQQVIPNVNLDNDVSYIPNNKEVSLYVPNDSNSISVKKVWVDQENKGTSPGTNSVKVQLYKVTKKKKTYSVTLHFFSSDGNNFTKTVQAAQNKSLHIEDLNWGPSENFEEGNFEVTKNGEDFGTVTCSKEDTKGIINIQTEPITEDCEIYITANNNAFWFDKNNISITHDEPEVETTKHTEGDPVTLDESNNWSHTWNNLTSKSESGEDYYYTVEEVGAPSGYQVSYTNNDGIQEGDITVTNKKLDNYDLPDTGGFGTFGYYAIGALFITATLFAYIANIKKKGAYN
ncbi:SpaA isopeptide-forming pilin-related protein [Catenibacterium mitsuokai]|uniref:SpaA isopeptide-forming pilin-related protein n=1 Tax=Catenibacterium mitsuokai TaxID=100886 RepID=UPI0022E42745|nr:SpaA isopeptide-forming pilin-related protein [Catenibacterium mitsuokai]